MYSTIVGTTFSIRINWKEHFFVVQGSASAGVYQFRTVDDLLVQTKRILESIQARIVDLAMER